MAERIPPPEKKKKDDTPVAPANGMSIAFGKALEKKENWKPKNPVKEMSNAEAIQTWEGEGGRTIEETATPAAETGELETTPLELEPLTQEERELYAKLPEAKKKSYLAHVATAKAEKEKKPPIFSSRERRNIINETLDRIEATPEISPEAKKLEVEEQRGIDERIAAERTVDDSDISAPQYAPRDMQEDMDALSREPLPQGIRRRTRGPEKVISNPEEMTA